MGKTVLSILAHPDDAEFLCAGTLTRLRQEHGWDVHIATMTAGDCGSTASPADEISRTRRGEATQAASLIGAAYHCLELFDLQIYYNEESLHRVTRLFRAVRPEVVMTHSPQDYLLDHEITSMVARAAAFAAPVPNFLNDRGHDLPLDHIPHLYYCDAIEGKDALGRMIQPAFLIDISKVIETKTNMLAAHASQRSWLLKHHGMDEYLESMRGWGRVCGQRCGWSYAEGFLQHLGHGYPQDNLLASVLGSSTA
jgi:N-acetylglucosamine malate deacetylase 1